MNPVGMAHPLDSPCPYILVPWGHPKDVPLGPNADVLFQDSCRLDFSLINSNVLIRFHNKRTIYFLSTLSTITSRLRNGHIQTADRDFFLPRLLFTRKKYKT